MFRNVYMFIYVYLSCDLFISLSFFLPFFFFFSCAHIHTLTYFIFIIIYFKHYSHNATALNQSKFTSIVIIHIINLYTQPRFLFLTDIRCNNNFDRTVSFVVYTKCLNLHPVFALLLYIFFIIYMITHVFSFIYASAAAD